MSQSEIAALLAEGEIAAIQAQEKAGQLTPDQAQLEIKAILSKKSGIVRSSLHRGKAVLEQMLDESLTDLDWSPEIENGTTKPSRAGKLKEYAEKVKSRKAARNAESLNKKTSQAFTGTSKTKQAA